MTQDLEHVKLKYKPVGTQNWPDLVTLFERNGGTLLLLVYGLERSGQGLSRSSMSDMKHSLHRKYRCLSVLSPIWLSDNIKIEKKYGKLLRLA